MFIKPDFNNNIVGLAATLAEYLGRPNGKPVLPALKSELGKGYRNVVFLILDGLGMHPLRTNLAEGSFLAANVKQTLTSVFPSTTTNATISFLTANYPMEHGWFGWSLYFEELGRPVDLFPCVDSWTGEPVGGEFVKRRLPVEPYYNGARGHTVSVVVPAYWEREEKNKFVWRDPGEIFSYLEEICKNGGRQFVYAYCDQPDAVMHRHGVTSKEARQVIAELNDGLERLAPRLSDTLLIVTADHGQTDIGGAVDLYLDETLASMLACPPYLEARAAAFKVKENCRKAFCEYFLGQYGGDFALYESKTLVQEGYFGTVGENAKLLGDYIAVGKTDKVLRLTPRSHRFKGHHTSLTKEEMEVPLIWMGL